MNNTDVQHRRRERSDKGQVRDTEADVRLLRFIAEQKAVDMEIVEWLRVCGPDAAQDWLNRRMQPKKYLRTIEFNTHQGKRTFMWVSATGMRRAGLPYKAERPGQVQHARAVAVARLYIQGVTDALAQPEHWLSERQIRRRIALTGNDHNGIHVPDGVFEQQTAVECERHAKSVQETAQIIDSLLSQYQQVFYVVSRVAEGKVRQAVETLVAQHTGVATRVKVLLLEDVEAEVRRRAGAALSRRSGARSPRALHPTAADANVGSDRVQPQTQSLNSSRRLFFVLNNTIACLVAAGNQQEACDLINVMMGSAEFSNQLRWQLAMIHIGITGFIQSTSMAQDMFQFLLDDMRLPEMLHAKLKAIGAARLIRLTHTRSLTNEQLLLPQTNEQAPLHDLQAVLEFCQVINWQDYRWNVLAAIGAGYEEQGHLREAHQVYSRLLSLDVRNVPNNKQAELLVALGRVCFDKNQPTIGRGYFQEAAAKLRDTLTSKLYQNLLRELVRICQWQKDGPAALAYQHQLDVAMHASLNIGTG